MVGLVALARGRIRSREMRMPSAAMLWERMTQNQEYKKGKACGVKGPFETQPLLWPILYALQRTHSVSVLMKKDKGYNRRFEIIVQS